MVPLGFDILRKQRTLKQNKAVRIFLERVATLAHARSLYHRRLIDQNLKPKLWMMAGEIIANGKIDRRPEKLEA